MLKSNRSNYRMGHLRLRTVLQSRPKTPHKTNRWTPKPRSPVTAAKEMTRQLQISKKTRLILEGERQMMRVLMRLM